VIAGGRIAIDDPRDPDVRALLERHLEFALAQTPPEHSFALDAGGLLDPAITLFSIRVHGSLLGIGAIKRLGPHHAEIKSMHTAETARGHGIGRAMLTHLLEAARAQGFPHGEPGDRDHGGLRRGPGAVPERGFRFVWPFRRLPAQPRQPVHDAGTRLSPRSRPVTQTRAAARAQQPSRLARPHHESAAHRRENR
jgi:putative acetyltransferase